LKNIRSLLRTIAKRNAQRLSAVEPGEKAKRMFYQLFYNELMNLNFIPAGRVLYGAFSIPREPILIVMLCFYSVHVVAFRITQKIMGNH